MHFSSMSNQRPPIRITPHIRLNSGRHEPIEDDDDSPPAPPRHGVPRALTSPSGLTSPSELPSPGIRSLRSAKSSDFLIPPKPFRARDEGASPDGSIFSSRRTSFDSGWAGSTSRLGYYPVSSLADSCPPSRGSSQEDLNTQTVGIKYNIMPSDGLLLFPEDVEKDDYLHNPNPEDKERYCDVCNRRGMVNMTGLILLILGASMLFIGYPVMYAYSVFFRGDVLLICAGRSFDKLCSRGLPSAAAIRSVWMWGSDPC